MGYRAPSIVRGLGSKKRVGFSAPGEGSRLEQRRQRERQACGRIERH